MIMIDQKKAMATIMASRKNKDGSTDSAPMVPSAAQADDGSMDGRHAAAQDIISAMDEKHPGKLMEAMANFHDLHKAHMENEPEE